MCSSDLVGFQQRDVATGYAELAFAEPSLTAKGKPTRDGHVTLLKTYDDGGSMRFAPLANGGGVQMDLGHAESFDLNLTKFATNTMVGEELLTRTLGPLPGVTVQPPFLDALLLHDTGAGVECSADFSNLSSPTVHLLIYKNGALMAERTGVTGQLGSPLVTLPSWPNLLGKLGGSTPCRRVKTPLGLYQLPGSGSIPPQAVLADELRVLAEMPVSAPHPDYYSEFDFIATADADWGITNVQRVLACTAVPLNITPATSGVTVTWTNGRFQLQGAENVSGPWFDLGAASPVTIPANSKARFFRLVCD